MHEKLEQVRHQVLSIEYHFLRLPFVAECGASSLSATVYDACPPELGARSRIALAKRDTAGDGSDQTVKAVRTVRRKSTLGKC